MSDNYFKGILQKSQYKNSDAARYQIMGSGTKKYFQKGGYRLSFQDCSRQREGFVMSRLQNYLSKTPFKEYNTGVVAYLAALDHIATISPSITQGIVKELQNQRSHLKLIASENFSSLAVQLAMGNLLTDKYAEGYAHHRFYPGCATIDEIEEEGATLLKEIFGCDHAYIQPHSGCDANLIAFWAILTHRIQDKRVKELGKKNLNELTDDEYEEIRQLMFKQKLMGLSLNSGGHLTHGYRYNVSSKMMRAVSYDVDKGTNLLNYDVIAKQVKEEKPTILLAGYSAYPRLINFARMREIADSVGAVFMVDMAHFAGLVAGKVFTGEYNPIPYAHVVTSTTHKTLRGPRGGIILCKEEFRESVDKGCPLVLGGPLPHVLAAKAVAFREINTPEFCTYSQNIVDNARVLAEELQSDGMKVITGGTDNHIIIGDVTQYGINGRHAEKALLAAFLTANRNTIPFDTNGPWYTSGIRVGTPATTTLGMGTYEMREIASIIVDILSNTTPTIVEKTGKPSKVSFTIIPEVLSSSQERVKDLLSSFPLYPELTWTECDGGNDCCCKNSKESTTNLCNIH